MPAILTQMVYLKYRAGEPPVSVTFKPKYRARVDTKTVHRSRIDTQTKFRARVGG